MVSLFKDRSPASIFWLFVLSIIVHSHFFVYTVAMPATANDGFISVFLNKYLPLLSQGLIVFLYHAVVVLQALRLNHLLTENRMYSRVNYLPAMIYILLTGLFTVWSSMTASLIDNVMVIWLFAEMVRLYNTPNPKTLLFNIGLLTGVSTILYHPSALLLPVAFFALMMLRPFVINEWLTLLIGALSPFYFLASYLYLTDQLYAIKNYIPRLQFNAVHVNISIVFFITVAIICILLFMGAYHWRQENRKLLIQIRKNWAVLLVMLIVLLPMPFINANAGIESLLLCIVPASPIIARGFLAPKKNTVPALMFWALIILAIIKNWQILK